MLRSPGDGPGADEQVQVWRAALEPLLAELGGLGEGAYAALTLDGWIDFVNHVGFARVSGSTFDPQTLLWGPSMVALKVAALTALG